MKKLQQFNILSFMYDRLENNNFDINLSTFEAEQNEELIALADNECLRAIRRLTHHQFDDNGESKLNDLFELRKKLIKQKNSEENRKKIADVNNKIRELLYIKEVISVTIPDKRKYPKLCKGGFTINGNHYIRLICSPAMARTNRALFCCDYIYKELDEILRCGCKQTKIVPAKWNAYYGLMSSATFKVSTPRVCVVKDLELKMPKEVDWATDNEHQDIVTREIRDCDFNLWDGMGLISPVLAKKWSEEVGYDGIVESFIVRAPFMKGLVATFDFQKFGHTIAEKSSIVDIYGKEYRCDDIDIIMTESQFKLWNAYDSVEQHQEFMDKFGISWGVTRIGQPETKKIMRTNYQFIQVLDLDDNDIQDVCKNTVDWFNGVVGGNYEKQILYMLGKMVKEKDINSLWNNLQDNSIKALMLEPELLNDNYISNKIVQSINKKMQESYIGKIIVDGCFGFLYFDPYALCEYVFGMEVKGLLKEFEFYADFWSQKGVDEICGLRSPMTWRAEVNKMKLLHSQQMQEWFQYLPSGIILNVWGNDRDIFSGSDADGDILATTDDKTFLKCRYGGVPVLYEHQKAEKQIIEI